MKEKRCCLSFQNNNVKHIFIMIFPKYLKDSFLVFIFYAFLLGLKTFLMAEGKAHCNKIETLLSVHIRRGCACATPGRNALSC